MSKVTDRATRCKRLLDDPDLTEAFDLVEQSIVDGFKQISLEQINEDGNILHELKLMLHLLKSVKDKLETAVSQGELEAFNAEQEKTVAPYLGDILSWRKKTKGQ